MTYRIGGEGTLDETFFTEAELIDRYVGNTLWTWGNDYYGGLGQNLSAAHKSSPVQTVAGGTNWKQVSTYSSSFAAIKTNGELWLWGRGSDGRLGNSSTVNASSPVQTVCGGTNWKQVASGGQTGAGFTTAAIKTDGTLWTWGYNTVGQLGDNTTAHKSSPVQTVAGGTNWKQVSLSVTLAAIKTDGTLWLCGYNGGGHLGDNSTTAKSSPVQTVAGGTNWKQVSCGYTTAAVKTDGTLWIWGRNGNGHLGDNSTTAKSSPVQTVCGGTNWKQVTAGKDHTAAIKTDGTLWTWGRNLWGQLGDSSVAAKSSPVQTVCGGTNWKQVACGYMTAGIKTDGTLWTWGFDSYGILGDNSTAHKSSPVQTVAGGTNWKQATCGTYHMAAITFSDYSN